MANKKYLDVETFSIGYDASHKTDISAIISLADKLVSSKGDLVEPVSAIDDKTPTSVSHRHRSWEVELQTDGFNYEAFMTQQVKSGDGSSRAIRQGADNDPIGYLVAVLNRLGGGTDTVTYQSGKSFLSGFSLKVSNKKGTKYNPCTVKFTVIGTRTVS